MRYLTLGEVVTLHRAVVTETGGADGIRDLGSLESAIAQPRATFDNVDLYPSVADKAASLAFGLAMNHPFVDGNKRIAHAAMSVFLELNGVSFDAAIDEQERLFLDLADGKITRQQLTTWLERHLDPR
jgi:death on curing protein